MSCGKNGGYMAEIDANGNATKEPALWIEVGGTGRDRVASFICSMARIKAAKPGKAGKTTSF